MPVKAGLKTLEFEKGKAGILVVDIECLGSMFDTLIATTVAVEFDRFLAASAEALTAIDGRGIPKTKKAA